MSPQQIKIALLLKKKLLKELLKELREQLEMYHQIKQLEQEDQNQPAQ